MNFEYLTLNVAERVATVTINRPDKGNALAPDVLEEVTHMFNAMGARQDVNVIVFTGGERATRPTPPCFTALIARFCFANNP